jgi:hypothetical protein
VKKPNSRWPTTHREKLTIKESGLELPDLEGTFDELIARLKLLKAWSETPRNPDTDEPDPDGVRYLGVGFGGPSGHGTALYYERLETDPEYEVRAERQKKDIARAEAKLKRLYGGTP